MESNIHSISTNSNNIRQDIFPFGQWTITTRKGIILQSKCTCHNRNTKRDEVINQNDPKVLEELCNICKYCYSLPQLYNMPDMLFNNNVLRLEHYTGIGLEFNALDALKLVEETKDPLRVAVADGWQSARADFPFAKSVVKPFDWTFTTNYRGTLLNTINKQGIIPPKAPATAFQVDTLCCDQQNTSSIDTPRNKISDLTSNSTVHEENPLQLQVEETDERIDVNKLKVREEILFYDDVTLYEDELADHGTAQYTVKVRVMPKSLFILARFYLRVDGVLARINDTRIYHEINRKYLLREYTNRESKLSSLNLPVSTLVNPNELMNHLPLIHSRYEKLNLPMKR